MSDNNLSLEKVTNPEAKRFLLQFLSDREINRDFYQLVPEEKFDFRMIDTSNRKSDSPRESITHQIDTTRDYINGVKTGVLKFRIIYEDLTNPQKLSKDQLLEKLEQTAEELITLLADEGIENIKVQVPWSKESLPAISSLWGLNDHEILHQGWNLAIMDHLSIPRFPSLQRMWGK